MSTTTNEKEICFIGITSDISEAIKLALDNEKPTEFFIYQRTPLPFLDEDSLALLGDCCTTQDYQKLKDYFYDQLNQTKEVKAGKKEFSVADSGDINAMRNLMVTTKYNREQSTLYDFFSELFSLCGDNYLHISFKHLFGKTSIITINPDLAE